MGRGHGETIYLLLTFHCRGINICKINPVECLLFQQKTAHSYYSLHLCFIIHFVVSSHFAIHFNSLVVT